VDRVLVVTGGLITPADRSLWDAIRKQAAALRRSEAVWLDLQVKLHAAERLLAQARYRRSAAHRRAPYRAAVDRFFDGEQLTDAPELTEVILATMLRREGLEVEVATYTELFADDALRERLLDRCEVVFASTTLLHDRAEMEPMLAMLRRPHNRVVAGGALASMIYATFEGSEDLDVLAIGYGEYLVPSLAAWIRSGFETLDGGLRCVQTAEDVHGRRFGVLEERRRRRTGASPPSCTAVPSRWCTTSRCAAAPIAAPSATTPTSSTTCASAFAPRSASTATGPSSRRRAPAG